MTFYEIFFQDKLLRANKENFFIIIIIIVIITIFIIIITAFSIKID